MIETLRRAVVALAALTLLSAQANAAIDISQGVNATVWFTWPRFVAFDKPGLLDPPIPPGRKMPGPDDFKQIHALGFRSLRLGVDPALFEVLQGESGERFTHQFSAAIDQAIAAGLSVVVDLHPNSRHQIYGQMALRAALGTANQKNYVDLVGQVAAMLAHYPDNKVALELMNEPKGDCKGRAQVAWSAMLDEMIAAARERAPQLALVVSGACTSSIEGLLALDASRWRDRNLFYTFHFYEPFAFTHQGASFIAWPEKYLSSVPWPVDGAMDSAALADDAQGRMRALGTFERLKMTVGVNRALQKLKSAREGEMQVAERFKQVSDWADRNGVPRQNIYVGEFGVYAADLSKPGAACADQARWVEAVRRTSEQQGFSWAFFHLDGAFGILDESGKPKPALLKALNFNSTGSCAQN